MKNDRSLTLLGLDSWNQFEVYWQGKIDAWNAMHPDHAIDATAGNYAIDHIKPISTFEPQEIDMANHYTNLQPLPKDINIKKSNMWDWEDEKFWLHNIMYQEQNVAPYLPVDFNINA